MPLLTYTILVTSFWVIAGIYLLISSYRVKLLKTEPSIHENNEPTVAIIIPIRNEEKHLAAALESVCNLSYKNKTIILINDRSTDKTPVILEQFSINHPNINVFHIQELPEGWLGKNHAMYYGYKNTTADWLLFTDADIIYKQDTLNKALHYCLQNNTDHLTLLPEIESTSQLLDCALSTFQIMLEAKLRPWEVSNPNSNASIGVGAFNLVKRTAYEAAGTHSVIALRPDDDLKLGAIIKQSGGQQAVLYGEGQISLEWYSNLKEFINGLMKNTFSVYNYNLLSMIFLGILPTLIFIVLPLPLLLFSGNTLSQLMAVVILVTQTALYLFKPGLKAKWWHALTIPLAGLLMIFIMIRSAAITLKQGGIYWRGSFYPLSELKKNR